ncbi:MAG: Asp-tRNA(Asn)/Glu-tRNA(Gln) amidotransferase subunit GatC [Candidatus Paceibacterota bacterium]|jgi:aspartyl-tRNA(Asn)/glutamyl-tRNA(Gln) amidotransferase subunit C
MQLEDVKKLADLARIEITDAEQQEFLDNLTSILSYVKQIESVDTSELDDAEYPLRNVMREDAFPYESEKYTEKLLGEAPDTYDGYLKVKKILSN